ncbi:MAG TPA: hypothetical protein VM282_22245 [Acidimicrobiales bacterium]|nr:hypothetical protein [Acidimicrobiales bacterium]
MPLSSFLKVTVTVTSSGSTVRPHGRPGHVHRLDHVDGSPTRGEAPAAIPNGRLAVIPGEHLAPLDKPALVAGLVLDFFSELDARS